MRIAALLLLIICSCKTIVPCRIVPSGEKGPHNMAELEKCCANLKDNSSERCDACSDQPQCGFCTEPKEAGSKCMARESVTSTVPNPRCGSGWCYNSTQCPKPPVVPPGATP